MTHECPPKPPTHTPSPLGSCAPGRAPAPPMQMLRTTRAGAMLHPEDHLALLLAALCHDLDHDGYSNAYHGEGRGGCQGMGARGHRVRVRGPAMVQGRLWWC